MTKLTDNRVSSGATLAVRYGVTTRQINLLAGRDLLVRAPDGKGFLENASTLKYMTHLRKVAAGRSGITDERLQLVREQRDKLALANAATRGESVKLIEVIRVWSDTFRGVSAKLLAIPDRLASRLPNLSRHDLHEIDQEIRIVLTETAEGYDPAKDHATGNTPVTNPKEENDNDEKAKKD